MFFFLCNKQSLNVDTKTKSREKEKYAKRMDRNRKAKLTVLKRVKSLKFLDFTFSETKIGAPNMLTIST